MPTTTHPGLASAALMRTALGSALAYIGSTWRKLPADHRGLVARQCLRHVEGLRTLLDDIEAASRHAPRLFIVRPDEEGASR